jgi:hypothetical protein
MLVSTAIRAMKVERCRLRTIRNLDNEDPALLSYHLNDLLWQTRFFHATDPRDRLFELMVIAVCGRASCWKSTT